MKAIPLLLAVLLFAQLSMAVPAAPAPTCQVEARILGMKPMQNGYYRINVSIESISTYEPVESQIKCDESYAEKLGSYGVIVYEAELGRALLKEGDLVSGMAHFGGDERLGGDFLSNISVLKHQEESRKTLQDPWLLAGAALATGILFALLIYFLQRKKQGI
jgi:hypothetical protein